MLNSQGSGLDVPGPLEKDEDLDQARPIPGGSVTYHVRPTTAAASASDPTPKPPSTGVWAIFPAPLPPGQGDLPKMDPLKHCLQGINIHLGPPVEPRP